MRIKLKSIVTVLILFFCIGSSFAASDSTSRLVQDVEDSVEAQREADSSDAADVFLLPFRQEIFICAAVDSIPPALLAAFIQEESAFNQWATRTEPHYKKKKIVITGARNWTKKHKGLPTYYTELDDRSRSYGLMQVMGQLAREQGFDAKYLPELFEPLNSISQGALKLRSLLKKYKTDTLAAISSYNAGSPRKKHGILVNARYVYRVSVAWKMYEKIFKKEGLINERENIYDQTDRDQPANSIRLGLSSRAFTWLQPPAVPAFDAGSGNNDLARNKKSNRSARFDSGESDDTDSLFISPGGSYPVNYIEGQTPATKGFIGFRIFLVAGFLTSLLGFGWFLFKGHHANRTRLAFSVPRSP